MRKHRCTHTHGEKGNDSILAKNVENWIQILTGSQMKCNQQPTVRGGGEGKKMTKPTPVPRDSAIPGHGRPQH